MENSNKVKIPSIGPLGGGPDHSKCPKRVCQRCQSYKASDLSFEEHKELLLKESTRYQYLKPCCPSFWVISCSCGLLREKVTPDVALYWLKDAINPSED
jgi:hypothetical protein